MRLRRINLRKRRGGMHPDIRTGSVQYLCHFDDEWHLGTFSKQWYGLCFDAGQFVVQFDGIDGTVWKDVYQLCK